MERKFILNNFELELSKTDERLLIQAKHTSTGDILSKIITQEVAKALSQEHNLDTNMIFELLKDFFESKPENTTLSLTEDGVLSYSCVIMYGKFSKQLDFSIELEKENSDQLGKLQDQVTRLTKRVAELEKVYTEKLNDRISELEKANDKRYQALERLVIEKFEQLEKMILKADEKAQEKPQEQNIQIKQGKEQQKNGEDKEHRINWTFNPSGTFASDYSFKDNNKVVVSKIATASLMYTQQALPKSGKSKFSFIIEEVEENKGYIFVGIAPNSALDRRDAYLDKAAFGLSHHGYIFKEGKGNSGHAMYKKGDLVSFYVDINSGKVEIFINDIESYKHTLPKEYLDNYTYYPCIITGSKGGVGATII